MIITAKDILSHDEYTELNNKLGNGLTMDDYREWYLSWWCTEGRDNYILEGQFVDLILSLVEIEQRRCKSRLLQEAIDV